MIYDWETEEERLKRLMAIPPRKKLEWLRQMNELVAKSLPEEKKKIIRELRESRGHSP